MNVWKRFRSAITGLFVSRQEAEQNPNTTVAETVDRNEKKEEKDA